MSSAPLRLLVIDDDEVDRQAIERMFARSEHPCEVTACDDAPSGLRALLAGGFDVVLLDYLLPRGNGLEILKRMQAERIDIPVVILSGQADQRVAVDLMREGAADYLIKDGLRDERLAITVRNVVAAHRAEVSARRHAEALSKLAGGTAGVVGMDYVHALVRQLADAFKVRHVLLGELGEQADCTCLALWSDDGFLWPRRFRADGAPATTMLAARECVVLKQAAITFAEGLGGLSGSMAGLAVRDQSGRPIGVLVLVSDLPVTLDLRQQDLLTMCAARAAAEIGRLRAEQALSERLRVEKAAARCACTLLADAEPARSLTTALGHLLETTTGGTLSLYEFAGSGPTLALRLVTSARREDHGQAQGPAALIPILPDFTRWQQDLAHGLMVAGPVRLLPADEQASLYQQGVRSVLAIPLRSRDSTIGMLRVDHHTGEHLWTREEAALVRSGAELIAAYLERRQGSAGAGRG
jgi:DNA-binding NarL/FixJ family response regulator/GAF domain-containing protein